MSLGDEHISYELRVGNFSIACAKSLYEQDQVTELALECALGSFLIWRLPLDLCTGALSFLVNFPASSSGLCFGHLRLERPTRSANGELKGAAGWISLWSSTGMRGLETLGGSYEVFRTMRRDPPRNRKIHRSPRTSPENGR